MPYSLTEKRILVTSGPTRANIDAVRFISNRSSGRLGCVIAGECLALGAEVTLVAGAQSLTPEPEHFLPEEFGRLRVLNIETVFDLLSVLEKELCGKRPYDAVIHAMAVLDYVPQQGSGRKTPSGKDSWSLTLVKTPKVILKINEWAPDTFLVGFKLEVNKSDERLREIALASLRTNRADLVVANDLTRIRDEVHPALIIAPDGRVLARPQSKAQIAGDLCRMLAQALA